MLWLLPIRFLLFMHMQVRLRCYPGSACWRFMIQQSQNPECKNHLAPSRCAAPRACEQCGIRMAHAKVLGCSLRYVRIQNRAVVQCWLGIRRSELSFKAFLLGASCLRGSSTIWSLALCSWLQPRFTGGASKLFSHSLQWVLILCFLLSIGVTCA